MRLNLTRSIGTQALAWIAIEQLSQEISSGRRHDVWAGEVQRFAENLAVHLVGILIIEGRKTCKHLVQEDAQSPPVHGLVIAVAQQQLRGKVLGCTAEGVGAVLVLHVKLAKAEVAEGNVTLIVEQDIFWLEIAVDDVEAVQALEGAQQLSRVETTAVDIETLFPLQMMEQLAAVDKSKNEVELLGTLEGKLEGNDERVVDLGKN